MNKKLTNTKGFPVAMMVLAFLLSAASVVQEFVMLKVYEHFFKSDKNIRDFVLLDNRGFFDVYGTAVFMFVFTFFAMLVLIGGAGKRTTGTKEGVLLVVMGISAAVTPAAKAVDFLLSGALKNTESDGDLFRAVNELVCYGLPVVISLLIVFAGLGILIKAGASKTSVEVFRNQPKKSKTEPKEQAVPQTVESVEETIEAVSEAEPVAVEAVTEELSEEANADDTPAVEQAFCRSCSAEITAGAKFCRSCGAKQEI